MDMHEQMRRLYQAANELKEITGQSELSRAMNTSPQTINNWEARGISKSGILEAEKIIGCSALWLQTGSGVMSRSQYEPGQQLAKPEINLVNNPDYPAIRRVKLSLSAGISGFSIEMDEEDHAPLVFGKYWYQSRGYRPEDLVAIRIKGASMEPGMYSGDTVVVNTADTVPVDGCVFAINYEGEAVIKRFMRDDGSWWLASDNADQRRFPRKLCAGDACIIIGRIVHKQSESI